MSGLTKLFKKVSSMILFDKFGQNIKKSIINDTFNKQNKRK